MTPWFQVISPHADIRSGRLDESVFAADLSDAAAGRGPQEYRDATLFFHKTHLTQGLRSLLATVLQRLASGAGEPVIQIQTPFGGGKTHSLIALYHLIRRGEELRRASAAAAELLSETGLSAAPEAAVVTFVGTAADPLGRTPWGELAAQLGRYALLERHDQERRAPGKDLLHALLGERPVLILMDEIAAHAVAVGDYRSQLMVFYQELTEAVKVSPRCALVVTLPSSAPYGEEGERALYELQQIFARVESIQTPVEGEEVYEVIRRRLFEPPGDATAFQQQVNQTALEFFETYQRLGEDVPREAREPAYRERMQKAYPFHPEVIDVLFERWSTFANFQRTRGVLRLLAQVVRDLYNQRHDAPLILPAHINLALSGVRGEFLRHVGSEFEGVIAADITAGGQAKAERLDHEMGSEYQRFAVARGLAQAIFFASFSSGERRGVGTQWLRLACLQPGLQPAIIGDALNRLEDELWYLHAENGAYRFSTRPNLNRVIVEKEQAIAPEQIDQALRSQLERMAGDELRVIPWPRSSQDVPDMKELKLAILGPDRPRQSSETEQFARALLEQCGQTYRVYRNTLLVLAPDSDELAGARQQIKRYLAYRAITDDRALMSQLAEESRRSLDVRLRDAESSLAQQVMSAYRHLARAGAQGVEWLNLGLPTVGRHESLARRVCERLEGEDILLQRIAPRQVLKALQNDEAEKALEAIYEAFLRYPSFPMLKDKSVLLNAVAQGVREGAFGARIGARVWFGEALDPAQLQGDAVLVRNPPPPAEASPAERREAPPAQSVREGAAATMEASAASPADDEAGRAQRIAAYALRAAIPWNRLSDFMRGVIWPLQDDGAELEITVSLKARTDGAIKLATIEQKVRETLRQIGARVEDERME